MGIGIGMGADSMDGRKAWLASTDTFRRELHEVIEGG